MTTLRDHVSEHEAQLEAQRVTAFRSLLARPLLGADRDEFALARRHFRELRRRFSELLGYELLLYEVRHGQLADLLVARRLSDCTCASDVVGAADDYPPTDEGRRNRLRHRLARRLIEEPVVYLTECG